MISNAVRHLLEADQHYKERRFPSATVSAVLSIEQAGKMVILVNQGSIPKKNPHAIHAILFVGLLKALNDLKWSSQWTNIVLGNVDVANLTLSAQQQQDAAAHQEIAEFLQRLQAGELTDSTERLTTWAEAVVAKEQREGAFKFWETLFTRGLQDIRLKATYVDITDSGDVQSDPNTFDDDNFAKSMCTGAVAFLLVTVLIAVYTRKNLKVCDLLADVPLDLTGWDAVAKAVSSIVAVAAQSATKTS